MIVANGGDVDRAMALQDWFSVQENHDLVGLGIEGTDWKAVGDRCFERLSTYSFPSYAILWRAGLERLTSAMTDSEKKVFGWAQDYDNFELDTFASFIPDVTPVKEAAAQMSNVITQYANPLFYGVGDVDAGLDKLKKAAGGEKGIRTLETVPRLHTFQACAFDHSAISPHAAGRAGPGLRVRRLEPGRSGRNILIDVVTARHITRR